MHDDLHAERRVSAPLLRDDGRRAPLQRLRHAGHGPHTAEPDGRADRRFGVLLGRRRWPFHPYTLVARSTLVLNTATVPGLAGQSGTITVGHDGRYGDLSGKTVALEPATGFNFDSPMGYRPR